jgi:hypothetical protein
MFVWMLIPGVLFLKDYLDKQSNKAQQELDKEIRRLERKRVSI